MRGHQRPRVDDETDPLARGGEPHGRPAVLGVARLAVPVDVAPVREHHAVEHGDEHHDHVEPPALRAQPQDHSFGRGGERQGFIFYGGGGRARGALKPKNFTSRLASPS